MCFRCSYSGIWDAIVGAWRCFCHHLFLLHTGVGLCVEKKIICGVTQAGCGPAHPILNVLRRTPPLAASTSVNVPAPYSPWRLVSVLALCCICPFPLQHGTWRVKCVTLNESLIVLIMWTEARYCEVCFSLTGCVARLVYLWSDTQTLVSTASAVLTSLRLPQSRAVYVTHTWNTPSVVTYRNKITSGVFLWTWHRPALCWFLEHLHPTQFWRVTCPVRRCGQHWGLWTCSHTHGQLTALSCR